MHRIAFNELIVCWVLWAGALVRVRRTKHKASVTASAANWGILLQSASYFLAWFNWDRTRFSWLDAVAIVLGPIAVALMWAAVAHLGKQWRVQAGLYEDHELVRSGPYRYLRHPLYGSMLLLYLATWFTAGNLVLGAFGLVMFIAGTEIRVRVEDSLLASRFGAEFREYRERVPAYLPFVR